MRKKIILVLLPVLFVLVFTGCTKKDAQEIIRLIPLVGGDEEINEAVLKKDIELCAKLEGKDDLARVRRQNKCVENVAKAIGDFHACFLIKDIDDMEEIDGKAARDCATDIAIETVDVSVCEEIDNFNYDVTKCYAELAPKLKDASLCSKAGEGTSWNNCIKETAKADENIAICDNFEASGSKGSCQADVAVVKGDPSLCERIEREDFKNNCYKNIALNTEDASLCDKTSTEKRKEQCREDLEKAKQKKQGVVAE